MDKTLVCTQCGNLVIPSRENKGSGLIELVLWLFMIIPGLIYSIWRRSKKTARCPKCGNQNLIPLDTPMGEKIVKDMGIDKTQIDSVQQQDEERFKKHFDHKNRFNLFVIGGIVLIIGIAMLTGSDPAYDSTIDNSQPSLVEAHAMGQGYVESVLKSPSTADFPATDGRIEKADENTYLINSYVDSQNGFGATVRSNWTMTIKYLGGDKYENSSWKVESFTLNGERII